MRGLSWDQSVKERAIWLRRQDKSIGEIVTELGVCKTTLFEWFKDAGVSARLTRFIGEDWMKQVQGLAAAAHKRRRNAWIDEVSIRVKEDVSTINLNLDLKKVILSTLYWAEGAKSGSSIKFVNVDPRMHLLFITLLRECYLVNEDKLRLRLHLHYYHRARKAKHFWSSLLNVPETQIGKIYWKKRSREKVFRRNEAGICTIGYNSVRLQEEILRYAYSLGERIAPVAQRIE